MAMTSPASASTASSACPPTRGGLASSTCRACAPPSCPAGPGLSLTALAGPNDTCELGLKEVWRPSWLDPWNARTDADYNIETWPAYRRVPAIVQGFHWGTITPPDGGLARLTGRQMFRYSVLQAAAATDGPGVQWAASPYTDGTWENGVAQAFSDLAARVQAVRESLRGVRPSPAYPVREGTSLSSLPQGIAATRRLDDRVDYLHVLGPPAGRTLVLPIPADGVSYSAARLLAGGNAMELLQDASGVRVTLPDGADWDATDTVLAMEISPASLPATNHALNGHVTALDSIEDAGLGQRVPWGLRNLVDGIITPLPRPASWSVENHGWSSKNTAADRPVWVQVELGAGVLLDTVRLHPRGDAGNIGAGFPIDFRISISADGSHWEAIADVSDQPLPATQQSYPFAATVARYIRVDAMHLRPNPADAGHHALQFAELEAFGPVQPYKAQSSHSLNTGFSDATDVVVDLSRRLMIAPMDKPARFFRLQGEPPPRVSGCWTDNGQFLASFEPAP